MLKQEEEQFNFLFELLVNQLIKNYLFIINNKLLMNKWIIPVGFQVYLSVNYQRKYKK